MIFWITFSIGRCVVAGAPELCGPRRGAGRRPAVGEIGTAGQSGLRALDSALAHRHAPRTGTRLVSRTTSAAASYGQGNVSNHLIISKIEKSFSGHGFIIRMGPPPSLKKIVAGGGPHREPY